MANLRSPDKGDKVTLIGMTAVKITNRSYEKKDLIVDEAIFIHGYCTYGKTETVMVDGYIGDSIIGTNGKLYPLRQEFDDDFYVVVLEE